MAPATCGEGRKCITYAALVNVKLFKEPEKKYFNFFSYENNGTKCLRREGMSKNKGLAIGVLVVLIAMYVGTKVYVTNMAERNVNEAIASVADFVDIDYKKVSVDLFRMDVKISDIYISPLDSAEKLKIDKVVLHDIDNKNDIPAFASLSCNGVEINPDEIGEHGQQLKNLGYNDKILVNTEINYAYDKDKREIHIKKFGIDAEDVGEIGISFLIGNISLGQEELLATLFSFPQIMFYEAEVLYNDDSFIERLMKQSAEKQQITLEDFRNSLIERVITEMKKEQDERIKSALSEIIAFLQNSDKISISASPSTPYSFARIMRVHDPKEIIQLLNVKIDA